MTEGTLDKVASLTQYVLNTCCSLFGNNEERNVSLLGENITTNENLINNFAADQSEVSLTISKFQRNEGEFSYDVKLGIDYQQLDSLSSMHVVFIKRVAVVATDRSIPSQFLVMNLTEDYSLEHMYLLLKDMVNPLFTSYTRQLHREGDKYLSSVQQKITELEISLLHLQQNTDIPDVKWVIHPAVTAMVQKAAEENRKPMVEDFGNQISDSAFLNQLQKDVTYWITEIKKVTQLQVDRETSSGSALQEINFWINLEGVLDKIQSKCNGEEIRLTLDLLKAGRRFFAAVSFDADLGLNETADRVRSYNILIKDFPIDNLLSANDLSAITSSIEAIFHHLKKLQHSQYPITRVKQLVATISEDVSKQMVKILRTYKLMVIPYDEFEQVLTQCNEVFDTWDDEFDKFKGLLFGIRKKTHERILIDDVAHVHKNLQERVLSLQSIHQQYETLHGVITRLLHVPSSQLPLTTTDSSDMTEERAVSLLSSTYNQMVTMDYLDITPEGIMAWDTVVKSYDQWFDRVESSIAKQLREKLKAAKTFHFMFRTLLPFKRLFVRRHIQGVVAEYRWKMVQMVRDEVKVIYQKVKVGYANSSESQMSAIYGFTPTAGYMIWALQIEQKLNLYLKKIKDLLGWKWDLQGKGQLLKEVVDAIKGKLNTGGLYEEWKLKNEKTQILAMSGVLTRNGKVINVFRNQNTDELKFETNCSQDIVNLMKEVSTFRWMNLRMPLLLVNKAAQCTQLYPAVVCVKESIYVYQLTCEKIAEYLAVAPVVADFKSECQRVLMDGAEMKWDSFKLQDYVTKLADCVELFQRKVERLIDDGGLPETVVSEDPNTISSLVRKSSGSKEPTTYEGDSNAATILADFFNQMLAKPKSLKSASPSRNESQAQTPKGKNKAPEKDETVKKMEDANQELTAQTEGAVKETEYVTQVVQRENQQKMEQLNIQIDKKEKIIMEKEKTITALENDKGDLAAKLQAKIQEADNIKQALQREHQLVVEQLNSKTKEKNDLIKKIENDRRELAVQFGAAKRDAENTRQNTEREHQRIIEQLNGEANEKEIKISQLEDTIKRQVTELDQMGVTLHEVEHSKQTLQMTHEETLQQKRDLETQLAIALDPLENIEELNEVVDLNEEIGRGAYGVVKKVSLHGTVCAAKDIHAIIINYAQQREFEVVKKNFLEECIKCSKLFHPNIVQFLGIYYPSKDAKLPWLVMEQLDCSLTNFLKKYAYVQSDVSLIVKISIIHDISLGLRYLHARDIIHRDLSSNNILLTKHLSAKITDLGVAKLIDPDGTRSHTLAPGTLYFLPPEATSTRPQYSKPVDVFSLGCVMIHLMTHEWPEPAAETHYDEILGKKVVLSEVERRQFYVDKILEPRTLKVLILQCLHDSSKLRPVIAEVCQRVETLKTSIPRHHLVIGDNALEFEEHLRNQQMRANEQLMEKEVEINRLSAALQEANKLPNL